jgi:hypothetical protein
MQMQLRTRKVEIKSLTLGDVIRFTEDGTLAKVPTPDTARVAMVSTVDKSYREAMIVVISAATGLKLEELQTELDLENVERVMAAVMGQSGLSERGKHEGEAVP